MTASLNDSCDALSRVVADGRYMGASDEYTAFRTAVGTTSPEEFAAAAHHAAMAWEFVVGFAENKPIYRSQILRTITTLMSVPSWRSAFASRVDLHPRVLALHAHLQSALSLDAGEIADAVALPVPSVRAHHNEAIRDIEWPDWAALQCIVVMGGFMGANDEFAVFNRLVGTVVQVLPHELDAQGSHAHVAWEFLIGFAECKPLYRLQLATVFKCLQCSPVWRAVYGDMNALHLRVRSLPQELQLGLDTEVCFDGAGSSLPINVSIDVPDGGPNKSGESSVLCRRLSEEELDSRISILTNEACTPAVGQVDAVRVDTFIDAVSAAPSPAAFAAETCDPPPKQEPEDTIVTVVRPFFDEARRLQKSEPAAAHYCRVHGLEQLMFARECCEDTAASNAMLFAQMKEAELYKTDLDVTRAPMDMVVVVERHYTDAISMDHGGTPSPLLLQSYQQTRVLLESLVQAYGPVLTPGVVEVLRYTKSRENQIRSSLACGATLEIFAPPSIRPVKELRVVAPSQTVVAPLGPVCHSETSISRGCPAIAPPSSTSVGDATGTSSLYVGWSAAKRRAEARKRADAAATAVGAGNNTKAKVLVSEAITLLEGLS